MTKFGKPQGQESSRFNLPTNLYFDLIKIFENLIKLIVSNKKSYLKMVDRVNLLNIKNDNLSCRI